MARTRARQTCPWREQGAGNARVRRGMIQLAWRFLMFQKESALALWYRARTADSRIGTRKTMIPRLREDRAGTQTGHRALALCHHWRAIGGRRLTSSVLKGLTGTRIPLSTIRRSRRLFSTTAELTIRGGGKPYTNVALDDDRKNGPAARSFPTGQARGLKAHADAHDWIMVRIRTDLPDTSSRREDAPQWRVPLGSYPDRQCRHPSSAGKARLAVHPPSACSGVKALRNTSNARRQAAKLC